jgi:hypothetical protein
VCVCVCVCALTIFAIGERRDLLLQRCDIDVICGRVVTAVYQRSAARVSSGGRAGGPHSAVVMGQQFATACISNKLALAQPNATALPRTYTHAAWHASDTRKQFLDSADVGNLCWARPLVKNMWVGGLKTAPKR